MKPDSTSYENILEVENRGSQLSTFYKIMSPVQITLESCTGLGETDQYSIQMFSPNGCWLHENSMDALFRALSWCWKGRSSNRSRIKNTPTVPEPVVW